MAERTLYLVSCVAAKVAHEAPARELYCSPWFRKARAYVEPRGKWRILSAEHGLVDPDQVIAPYEKTLSRMPARARREWAGKVLLQLGRDLSGYSRVVVLAGARYREHLVVPLRAVGVSVEIPMEGLGIGRQLHWLGARTFTRLEHLERFYALMDRVAAATGGPHSLADGRGAIPRKARGVYFFFEPGEERADSGSGSRIVRVGTHAVSHGSKSTLWNRLAQHRGRASSLGGNHRGSVFRLLIGRALVEKEGLDYPHWGLKGSAAKGVRDSEKDLEARVSNVLHGMPYLWLLVGDEPSKSSDRAYLERNSIALLSNRGKQPLDSPSDAWLGSSSHKTTVRESGLWNSNHVDEEYDPAFLDLLERYVRRMANLAELDR